MSKLYQKGPSNVPADLTNPTSSFKKHVIIATLSLFFFVAVYLVLMCWFARLSYTLFSDLIEGSSENSFFTAITAICLAFLSLFMLKSLFIFKKGEDPNVREVKAKEEPELINYLHALADEAGAPRPHKVILTTRVNASVFYDLSILNLILPSKKNLEIGLGLINVLNLGELKAVLAHEFGHFAQRSMLLGRYVYTAQQIAVRVINKRDALDSIISGISSIDIRIAWIGWILSILIWAVRSLIHTLFSAVAVAERALSREMEFQADLVAVSLTGSDALINALYKLRIADEAYHAAIDSINDQLGEKKAASDLFALQTNHIDKMRWILNEPTYGKTPENINKDGSERVFTKGAVNAPEMWSTHPSSYDREENAKRTYIYADINEHSSWELFSNPERLKLAVTKELIDSAKLETTTLTTEESISLMNKSDYNWTFLDPKYKGAYLSRESMLNFETVEAIYAVNLKQDLAQTYTAIYTEELSDQIEEHRKVASEIDALELVTQEVLTAEKRIIVHRGNRIKRKDIPEIIEELKQEEVNLRAKLITHDQMCRKVNHEVCLKLNTEVGDYQKHLVSLLHYSEHALANLRDIYGKFSHTLTVIMADGKVTADELTALISDCNELHRVLKGIYGFRSEIKLDRAIIERMGKEYSELLEEFTLGLADRDSINQWIDVAGSWVNAALFALNKLRNASLEQLLNVETRIQEAFEKKQPLSIDVQTITPPDKYKTMVTGSERKRDLKLSFWDRFIMGDGIIPTVAKFVVSAGIIVGALYLGNKNISRNLYVYNGLNTAVFVEVNGEEVRIEPYGKENISISYGVTNNITTTTLSGDTIEVFTPQTSRRYSYVYNVASAGMGYEYTVSYGYDANVPNNYVGTKKWHPVKSDYILTDPPEQLKTSSSRTTKTAFAIESAANPYLFIDLIEDPDDLQRMVEAHVKFDDEGGVNLTNWIRLAAGIDSSLGLLVNRLEKYPNEVETWRLIQDNLTGSKKDSVCQLTQKMYVSNPESGDVYYLKVRCMENGKAQDELFLDGAKKWTNNAWLTYASGYVYSGRKDWEAAYESFGEALIQKEGLFVNTALDFERIHKMVEKYGKEKSKYNDLLSTSEEVNFYRRLEQGMVGENAGEPSYCYYLLAQNKLEEASLYASNYPEITPYLNWSVAASKGASKETLEQVFSYTEDEGLSASTIWMSIALRYREGKSINKEMIMLQEMYRLTDEQLEGTKKFLAQTLAGNYTQAEKTLSENDFYFQFNAYRCMMGLIIAGEDAPESWKEQVDRLLFVSEKPYLGLDEPS